MMVSERSAPEEPNSIKRRSTSIGRTAPIGFRMPRLKKKYMQAAPAPVAIAQATPTPYFRMKDGQKEVAVSFWALYKLHKSNELPAASLTPGGALYVKRSDFDKLWNKKAAA